MRNVAIAWPDVVEMNWQWVGANVPVGVDHHEVTLRVPGDGEKPFVECTGDELARATRAIVEATTHFEDAERVASASRELGEPMPGLEISAIEPLQNRGW